jgi:hypothetical protein
MDDCQITDDGVVIGAIISAKTIPFSEIKDIRKVSFWKGLLECLRPFKPPIRFSGGIYPYYVLIETAKSRFAVHPENGDKFVRLVSSQLKVH